MVDVAHLKKVACDAIDRARADLNEVSQEIWKNPELCFQEKHAHMVLTNFLEKQGFPVTRNFVVDTGFKAEWENGDGPCVSVLCEYDALPEIGHACGHNLIAEAGAGAGVGIKAAMQAAKQAGGKMGKLVVYGTPAEEGGGGKIDFINAGAFKGIDVSMMVHPFVCYYAHAESPPVSLATSRVNVRYLGKASHAAGSPWEGVNALDAAVMAYQSISNLRQQMKPNWRMHGIISNGGAKPNIIPEEASLYYQVRAPTMSELRTLVDKATRCFDAAALATGCKVEIDWDKKSYANVISNMPLMETYKQNAPAAAVDFNAVKDRDIEVAGSTDMGNVSYEVPVIHPLYYVGTDQFIHTRGFTPVAGSAGAQPYTLAQAKAMAMTAIDVMCDPKLLASIKDTFSQDLKDNA